MTGPIVKGVRSAFKAQCAADRDGAPANFEEYWHAFTPAWFIDQNGHYQARARDEAACGPKEQARRDAERAARPAARPPCQMAFA
jgi:hypothetical protein